MKQLVTQAIILNRIEYGEADRIVTFLTPKQGKLRLMAKGVRKIKSKLAGGIELFSVSDITYISGRGSVGTLISARLNNHYASIIKDISRVQLGYELIKELDRATEDHTEAEYFDLIVQVFTALDDQSTETTLIDAWFRAQIIRLAGHSPALRLDESGQALDPSAKYRLNVDDMALVKHENGQLGANEIKLLRLLFSDYELSVVKRVAKLEQALLNSRRTLNSIYSVYIKGGL